MDKRQASSVKPLEGGYESVACRADLREGKAFAARHGGVDVLVCLHREKVYAFENRCPHQGKPMDGAVIRNGQLVCPHHGARFHLETGHGEKGNACIYLRTLKVRVTATNVEVHIDSL
jgi:nitrite reductase/ring-hydroxylating ferredoxin subunit